MEDSVDRIKEPANKVTRPFGYGSMFYYSPTELLQVGQGHRLRSSLIYTFVSDFQNSCYLQTGCRPVVHKGVGDPYFRFSF